MTTTYVTTNMSSGFSVAAQGDVLEVLSNGIISTTGTGVAVSSSYGCEIDVFGTIAGGDYGLYSGAAGQSSYIYLGATGNVLSAYYSSQFANVAIDLTGTAFVDNYGQVLASGSSGSAVGINGQTEVVNHGAMSGSSSGVTSYDSKATDVLTLDNYGTIDGGAYALQGRGEIDIIFNAGTMTGAVYFGSASGGSLDNTGTINGSVTAANGTTVTNSGVIMGSVNISDSAVNLYGGSITVSGADDTVMIDAGTINDLTIGGNGASGTADVVNGSNANVVVSQFSNVQVNGNSDTVDVGPNSNAAISGFNETVYFYGGTGNVASLFDTTNNWDNVFGSNGAVALNTAQANVIGGGDTIGFGTVSNNVVELYATNNSFDQVTGTDGLVALNTAQANISGGGNTIDFASGTGNIAEIYGTNNNWDQIFGSNGLVALNSAQSNVTGNSDVIDMQGSSGNLLGLYGTSDTINFQPQFGTSAVVGFGSSDVMGFSKSDFANFQALQSHMTQSGGNTVITLDASDTVTLYNTTASSLTSSQFSFT